MHQSNEGDPLRIEFGADEYSPKLAMDDFSGVADEITARTDKRVFGSKNVSNKPIFLDIWNPDYPDLQFIDLPGFTKTPVNGQDATICQDILDCNLPFMQGENTLILAIQDASQDIGNSAAMEISEREDVDPNHERTIGVLTKLDTLTAATDKARAVKILRNETKPLKYGYFGVINRSQDNIDQGLGMDQSQEKEAEIKRDPAFADIRSRIGILQLRGFISRLLANKMEPMLPELRNKATEDLRNADRDLKEHGRLNDQGRI